MKKIVRTALAASFVTLAATGAKGADIIDPPVYTPPVVTKSHGGWYLRGDIGYAHMSTGGVSYYQGTPTLTGSFETYDLDATWMIGGGIGYQATDYFRVDATIDHYFSTDFDGSSATGAACAIPGAAGQLCDYSDTSDLNVTTVMANAYIDLGNFSGFTPYVGAGIGGAYVHWDDLDNDETCVVNCGSYVEADSLHPGYQEWRFAWALHAGMSYDISHNLKFDAGYTYTHIEGGNMFGFPAGSGNSGVQGIHDDMEIHAVKAGLRYTFN